MTSYCFLLSRRLDSFGEIQYCQYSWRWLAHVLTRCVLGQVRITIFWDHALSEGEGGGGGGGGEGGGGGAGGGGVGSPLPASWLLSRLLCPPFWFDLTDELSLPCFSTSWGYRWLTYSYVWAHCLFGADSCSFPRPWDGEPIYAFFAFQPKVRTPSLRELPSLHLCSFGWSISRRFFPAVPHSLPSAVLLSDLLCIRISPEVHFDWTGLPAYARSSSPPHVLAPPYWFPMVASKSSCFPYFWRARSHNPLYQPMSCLIGSFSDVYVTRLYFARFVCWWFVPCFGTLIGET